MKMTNKMKREDQREYLKTGSFSRDDKLDVARHCILWYPWLHPWFIQFTACLEECWMMRLKIYKRENWGVEWRRGSSLFPTLLFFVIYLLPPFPLSSLFSALFSSLLSSYLIYGHASLEVVHTPEDKGDCITRESSVLDAVQEVIKVIHTCNVVGETGGWIKEKRKKKRGGVGEEEGREEARRER